MKLKYLSVLFFMLAYNSAAQQFNSLYEAERFVKGSWVSTESSGKKDIISLTLSKEVTETKIRFFRDHTFIKTLGKMWGNKQVEGTWEVRRDDNGYYLHMAEGQGFRLIWRLDFDQYDYLVDDFGVRYRKE